MIGNIPIYVFLYSVLTLSMLRASSTYAGQVQALHDALERSYTDLSMKEEQLRRITDQVILSQQRIRVLLNLPDLGMSSSVTARDLLLLLQNRQNSELSINDDALLDVIPWVGQSTVNDAMNIENEELLHLTSQLERLKRFHRTKLENHSQLRHRCLSMIQDLKQEAKSDKRLAKQLERLRDRLKKS